MKFLKHIFLLLILVSSFSKLATAQVTVLDKIIAKVDNYYLLKSELETQMAQYAQSGQQAPPKCQLLESLVVGKLMLAKSDIDSVTVEEKPLQSLAHRGAADAKLVGQLGFHQPVARLVQPGVNRLQDQCVCVFLHVSRPSPNPGADLTAPPPRRSTLPTARRTGYTRPHAAS